MTRRYVSGVNSVHRKYGPVVKLAPDAGPIPTAPACHISSEHVVQSSPLRNSVSLRQIVSRIDKPIKVNPGIVE
jgi:hypothetical protein